MNHLSTTSSRLETIWLKLFKQAYMIPFEYASFTRQINITVISLSLCVRVKKNKVLEKRFEDFEVPALCWVRLFFWVTKSDKWNCFPTRLPPARPLIFGQKTMFLMYWTGLPLWQCCGLSRRNTRVLLWWVGRDSLLSMPCRHGKHKTFFAVVCTKQHPIHFKD